MSRLPDEVQAAVDLLADWGAEQWSERNANEDPDASLAIRDWISGAVQAQVEDPDTEQAFEHLGEAS